MELTEVDLNEVLLVEIFGVWERRGENDLTVRAIHNFRKNGVNDYAWMPQKVRYDSFQHALDILQLLAGASAEGKVHGSLHMGKAYFRSAFKTLPRSQHRPRWDM